MVQNSGGGIFVWGDSLTISSCAFSANSAEYNGGGIETWLIDSLTISGSMFSANCAKAVRTFNHMCSCMLRLLAAQHVPHFGSNF